MNKSLLEFTGSLLLNSRYIISPYGISKKCPEGVITRLNNDVIYNNAVGDITVDYSKEDTLTVVNGMGVTLGDSIIGIAALHAIKIINPDIFIRVVRPENCPAYVNDVYNLASNVIDEIHYMPFDIKNLNHSGVTIDMGNQLYRDDFNRMEMHDFFIRNLGVSDHLDFSETKSNSWLQDCNVCHLDLGEYVLFTPNASTKIRSIPEKYHSKIITDLTREHGKKVFGFIDINHSNYVNISSKSRSTSDFISIIKNAQYLYTCDSSALHIAAGFNVPSTCIFTTIKPELRSIYYKRCHSVYAGSTLTAGVHSSDDEQLIDIIDKKLEVFYAHT